MLHDCVGSQFNEVVQELQATQGPRETSALQETLEPQVSANLLCLNPLFTALQCYSLYAYIRVFIDFAAKSAVLCTL